MDDGEQSKRVTMWSIEYLLPDFSGETGSNKADWILLACAFGRNRLQ
jgi:hypothetical protein